MSIETTAASSLLVDVVRDLAGQAWRAATGGDGVKDSIDKVVGKAVGAALDTLRAEMLAEFAALQLAYDIRVLADRPRDVLDAFTPKGEIKPLGLEITIVGPDESLESVTIPPVEIDERFDGDK